MTTEHKPFADTIARLARFDHEDGHAPIVSKTVVQEPAKLVGPCRPPIPTQTAAGVRGSMPQAHRPL